MEEEKAGRNRLWCILMDMDRDLLSRSQGIMLTDGKLHTRYGCSLLVDLRGEGAPPTWLERESLLQYTNERCEYEETPHHC
ncbi:unnamed protein product [Allacma fusca]|uniref:Uncharacterized protein n=1 Tax=Allacma fusca TaxID=39272 RepID=A0A8J2LH66_9HEXA|nr:unnamed protein product [Allacma fusca]